MYYIDRDKWQAKMAYGVVLIEQTKWISERWQQADIVSEYAQQRALHLSLEWVTDIGSMLIDTFMMRDASSYEDIVDILRDEGVISPQTAQTLRNLVSLRRTLLQDVELQPSGIRHPLLPLLPEELRLFALDTSNYLKQEMI